jgi:surfeit locus 1 family protein
MAAPVPGDETLPVEIAKEIDLSDGPHLSYAMQWFIFSLGLGAGCVLYVNRSLRRPATGNRPRRRSLHEFRLSNSLSPC